MNRLFTILILCALPGCATVLRGKTQAVRFETDPTGANVCVDGKDHVAPVVVTLRRKESHDVTVSMAGYRPITFKLEAQWDALSLTSLPIPGGSVMMAYDTLSGADKSFNELAKIVLVKSSDPNSPPLVLYNFRGRLMTKEQFDHAWEQARWDPDPG